MATAIDETDYKAHLERHRALDEDVERNSKVLFEKTNGDPPISVQLPLMRKDISTLLAWMVRINKTAIGLIVSLFVIVFGQFLAVGIVAMLYLWRLINDMYPGQFP